jgi:hypothetical protein
MAAGLDLTAMLGQIITARRSRDVCAGPNEARKTRAERAAAAAGGGTATGTSGPADGAQQQAVPAGAAGRRRSSVISCSSVAVLRRGSGSSMMGRRAAQLLHNAAGGVSSMESNSSSAASGREGEGSDGNVIDEDEVYELTPTSSRQLLQGMPLDKLEQQLALANDWQFDAFALAEASGGHPVSTLAYYLFVKQGLLEKFSLKPAALARFLRRVEAGYKDNPYHNSMHAADVLQTLHCIVTRGGLIPGYVDPLHLMACYTAAVSWRGEEEACCAAC